MTITTYFPRDGVSIVVYVSSFLLHTMTVFVTYKHSVMLASVLASHRSLLLTTFPHNKCVRQERWCVLLISSKVFLYLRVSAATVIFIVIC